MIATAIYLMFLTWLSVEHGAEATDLSNVAKVIGAGILALMYDLPRWRRHE